MTMVWVVSRSRLKVPPGTSYPYISPLTPPGQRNCASWASQSQKSVTLPPQPEGGDHESLYEHVVTLEKKTSWIPRALKIKPMGCPETSVRNYHSTLANNPEKRGSHLHLGGAPEIKHRGVCLSSQI